MTDRYSTEAEMNQRCQAFFEFDQHECVGEVWRVKDVPLRRRLSQINPSWSMSAPVVGQLSGGGLQAMIGVQVVTITGSLLFLGATRAAIVTAAVQRDQDGKFSSAGLIKAIQEAQDNLLMALAQQWNIGAYCKDIPTDITTPEQLESWLG